MGAHSVLPPSGAAAWRRCAMWVTMNQRFPQDDTPEAAEGTAAHWVFSQVLVDKPVSEGMAAPNEVVVTDEMIDGAELMAEAICNTSKGRSLALHIEEPVSISRIHPQCWGTPDVWAFDRDHMLLDVFDYKFGHGFVDEFENDQGVAYIAGLIDKLAEELGVGPGLLDQQVRVRFHIIQPRCYYRGAPIRTWDIGLASNLRGQINTLSMAALAALGEDPPARTNPECRNCPGRHACSALQQAAYADAEYATRSSLVELSSSAASLELRMLERAQARLDARVDGLREVVSALGRSGQPTPFHRLESKPGRVVWNAPVDQIVAIGQLMGVDLAKPGAITPSQARKAGIDDAVIKAYSITQAGSIKLVPDNPTDVRKVFGK